MRQMSLDYMSFILIYILNHCLNKDIDTVHHRISSMYLGSWKVRQKVSERIDDNHPCPDNRSTKQIQHPPSPPLTFLILYRKLSI